MTFKEWGETESDCEDTEAMWFDWKAERDKLLSDRQRLVEAAWDVIGECGLNESIERLENVLILLHTNPEWSGEVQNQENRRPGQTPARVVRYTCLCQTAKHPESEWRQIARAMIEYAACSDRD